MFKIRCNMCMNEYQEEELMLLAESTGDSETYYTGCPECLTDQYLMDIEHEINRNETTRFKNLVEYGIRIAELNKISYTRKELEDVANNILNSEEYNRYYEINKEIFNEVMFNYVCFGDE